MKDGKPQNGYDRLLIKYKALEAKCEELQARNEQQQTTISKLKADLHNSESDRLHADLAHSVLVDELFDHMGWFRRALWWFDHPQKKGGE